MARLRIRRGDRVRVISGNERGKDGTVLRVDPEKGRVVVQGINLRKRHRKPSATDPDGGIVAFEAPIHASNVMLIDPATGEPTRVRAGEDSDGRKTRVAVKSGKPIPRP